LQAYFEWMPIREPTAARARDAIQRRFTFGDLADLIMVETRLGARTEQLSLAKDLTWRGEGAARTPDLQSFQAKLADPSRQLMGPEQLGWLERELAGSRAAGRPWQVLGNQVVMARVAIPDARKILAPDKLQALLASLSPEVRPQVERSMALAQFGAPFTLDSWDGYPAERERLYQAFRRAGVRPVVVSGDSHAFWVNDLAAADGSRAAVEFGTTAISSPSPGDQLPGFPLGEALAAANPEVVFCDQRSKGFLLLRLTREAAHAELHAVSRIDAKPFDTTVVKRFRVPAGQGGPQEA